MRTNEYDFSVLTAMFVDDSPYMRRLIHDLLIAMGFGRVITANDGESALALYKDEVPDILITDASMHPMDGYEFVRRIRTDPSNPNLYIPIIMLSGHVEMANIERARDNGVTEYLAKPVSATSLHQRVVSVIEQPRQFVKVGDYFGPDRRRHTDDVFFGDNRRDDLDAVDSEAPDSIDSKSEEQWVI
ncbi:MAG: response regulator [Rhodobiaceae bacterium]|nr:response regulator [Rhodobiaceae bacterium]